MIGKRFVEGQGSATLRTSMAMLLSASASAFYAVPAAYAVPTKPERADRGITAVVEAGLRFDRGVSPDGVDVSTSQGIVTISGIVPNLLAKDRTVEIAESLRGVRGVIDRTTVTPVSRPDEDIRKSILRALLQDPATESYQVAASVENGIATLRGAVGSYAEKQLAERIAKGVKGIKEVRNDITISYLEKRTDAEIATDVKARLEWDLWLNGAVFKTSVKDGKVTVGGRVGSAGARSRALEDAWVNGVAAVDVTTLTIEPRDDARHRMHSAVKSDAAIQQATQAALNLDPRVAAFAPNVTVEGGGVILSGAVGSLKAKAAAESDAHNVVGVWRVDNLLKVRPKGTFVDAELEKRLKVALSWDPALDSSTIDVAVMNHTAYLSGAVESRFERSEAEDVASRTNGVLGIRNHLEVEPEDVIVYDDFPYGSYYDWPYYKPPPSFISRTFGPGPYMSDAQMKKDIEDALSSSPFVDREHATVTVHGGVATLSGEVGTWIGWREADKNARRIAGFVINRLTIQTGPG